MDPAVIDFSPYPGQDANQLRARIETAETQLREAGFEVVLCKLPDDVEAAEAMVREALTKTVFDIVEIGSGLRTSHEYTLIFERVLNTLVEAQPGIRFCFNDPPETTIDAVRRASNR